MGRYNHLTKTDRKIIEHLLELKKPIQFIADVLDCHRTTIYREISKYAHPVLGYLADFAQVLADRAKARSRRHRRLENETLKTFVQNRLWRFWSPAQIIVDLEKHNFNTQICCSTIYRNIYDGFLDRGKERAKKKLRSKGRRRYKKRSSPGIVQVNKTIHERPIEVNERNEFGHWEIDTVMGIRDGSCIVTLVERQTRLITGGLADSKSIRDINKVLRKILPEIIVRSITADRGAEFAGYREIEKEFGIVFYFADPHCPWQRGSNENANRLLRDFAPKGRSMDNLTEEQVRHFFFELNSRPRKCLGNRTSLEVYEEVSHLQ